MMAEDARQFAGWAIVEMLGHQQVAGYVTTEYFGNVCLFRVDVPAIPSRDITVVYRKEVSRCPEEPEYTRYLGPGSIYSLNPSTEETVRQYLDRNRKLAPVALDLAGTASQKKLAAAVLAHDPWNDEEDDEEDDD